MHILEPYPIAMETHMICTHMTATVLEERLCLLATRSEMGTSAEATWNLIRGESREAVKKEGPMHTL